MRRTRRRDAGLPAPRRHAAALLPAAATVLLTSAAAGFLLAGGGPGVPPAHAAPRPARALTTADTRLLDRAEQILIRSCMARHGFRYWLVPPPGLPFPYLVSSVAQARRQGFGGGLPAGPEPAAARRYLARLAPARRQDYGLVLNGPGPAGPGVTATLPQGVVVGRNTGTCRSRAETTLYGDFRAWFRASAVTGAVAAIWPPQVLADPAYQQAARRWAACMRAVGFRLPSPAAAAGAFRRPAESRPRRREIQVAVAEAGCARRAGLSQAARQLSAKFAGPLDARYRAAISADRRLSLAALPRARAIAAPGP